MHSTSGVQNIAKPNAHVLTREDFFIAKKDRYAPPSRWEQCLNWFKRLWGKKSQYSKKERLDEKSGIERDHYWSNLI